MFRNVILSMLLAYSSFAHAQSYTDTLLDYRDWYKESLLAGSHGLKPEDTAFVRFYDVDTSYRVNAVFTPTTGAMPFLMETKHGGTRRSVREYGTVYFNLSGAVLTLHLYRFTGAENDPTRSDRLFIPFTDLTNYKETFGGGRYLDVSVIDIKDNRLVLDFNKCYNPHTAYEKGYPYPIPPGVNNLRVAIKAGEKIFGHNPGY